MKHYCLLLLTLLLLLGRATQAQTPDGVRRQLDQIFANVDKSQVPSGYLDEYGEQLLGLRPYNGVLADTNRTDLDVFRYLRATIFSALVSGTDTLPSLPELNRRLAARRHGVSGAPNPIAVQYMSYHRIRPDALQNNLLTVQNNLVYDVAGRTQSPYQAATLFAAAPLYAVSRTGTVSLVFARNLYLTNNPGVSISGLYLDFDDGRGYIRAYWDQPATASYSSTGHKHIRVKVAYSNILTGGPRSRRIAPTPTGFSLESHFDLEVLEVSAVARYGAADDITQDFTSNTGAHDGATVSVRYGRGHTHVTKPFIIVEQYNLASILNDLAPELIPCDNGNNTIDKFLDKINDVNFDGGRGNFNDVLHNVGQYDIVYIDFKHNTDDIRRNAVLFQEVVRWVNALKAQGGSTEPNVVMGQSMGGLVSRYGLAQMTRLPADPDPATGRNRNNPETRLLVLHDSPQRGAYSPVGTQSLTRALDVPGILGIWSVADFSNTAKAAIKILDEPASQQLSILNAYDPRGSIRPDPFLNGQYRQVVYFDPNEPVQPAYTIVATSDGSQCGRLQNTPVGVTLASTTADFFLRPLSYLPSPLSALSNFNIKADGAAYGLPAYGQRAVVSRLRVYLQYNLCIGFGPFKACFPLIDINFINETAQSPANTLPYETLPGGNVNPHDNAACSPPIDYYVPFLFRVYMNTSLYNGDLCFVPTYSALDVDAVTPATAASAYLYGAPLANAVPRIQPFIAQANPTSSPTEYNIPHLRFNARNSEWIFNNMQGQSNAVLNCVSECNPYAAVPLNGPDIVCPNGSDFSVTPPFGNVTDWAASPAGLVTFTTPTAGATRVTVVPVSVYSSGFVTLSVTLSNGCFTKTITRQVAVGRGSIVVNEISGYDEPRCASESAQFYIPQHYGTQGPYTWQVSHGYVTQGQGTDQILISSLPRQTYQLVVTVSSPSTCAGEPAVEGRYVQDYYFPNLPNGQPCDMYRSAAPAAPSATLYPNPATETVDVHIENTTATQPITVRLFDSLGRPRAEQTSTGEKSVRLKTSHLPAGLYFVHILRGKEVLSRQQLRVEK